MRAHYKTLTAFVFEKNVKNIFLSVLMLLFNFLAAALEGISFSILLLAFSFVSQETAKNSLLKKILESFHENPTVSELFVFAVLLSIIFQGVRCLFSYLGQLMTSFLTVSLQEKTQEKIYAQIFRFSYPCISAYKMGDLISYTSAPTSFFSLIMDAVNRASVSLFILLSYVCLMFWISSKLTFILLSLFAIAALLQRKMISKMSESSQLQSEHVVTLSKENAQYFNGLKLIHLFSHQEQVLKRIKTTLKKISFSTFQLNKWNHLIIPINEAIGILLSVAALVCGLFLLKGNLVAALLTFLILTYRFSTRLQILMTSIGTLAYHMGHIERVQEILSDQDKEFESKKELKCDKFQEQITFENVSFTYPQKKTPVIQDVSFSISKGQILALVGASGAGKSTLIDLLLRLYEPQSGHLLIDGKNAQNFDLKSWRQLFGVVPQDCFLFHDTIKENIRFGNVQATQEKIIEAAKIAGAHSFISNLPDGYQTVVGEKGYRLSGGERQRVSLARALVRNPQILVLDEATSNLDSRSELLIQRALEFLRKDKTIILVAHRLSTITMADVILVLEKGKIIEKGTHLDLLQLGGRYHSFWTLQSREKKSSRELIKASDK